MNAPGVTWQLIVPWILSLITVGWGIMQFSAQQRQAGRQPFLQRQLDLCFLATETAARLATEIDPGEWEKARLTFWRLYWGPLSIVEDRAVEAAMVELGKLIPEHAGHPLNLPIMSLRTPSYRLAHAVRDLVAHSWRVELLPLQGRNSQRQVNSTH